MSFDVISPIDDSVLTTIKYMDDSQCEQVLIKARLAQKAWAQIKLSERQLILRRFVDEMLAMQDNIGIAISKQMGRPLAHAKNEVLGLKERADYLIETASSALADIDVEKNNSRQCFIRKQALGCVLVIAPWNYPLLTAVNAIVPALLSGNAVLLKHSSQTPLCAQHFAQAFEKAGLPEAIFQTLFINHEQTGRMLESSAIDYVSFTGSVAAGYAIQASLSKRFINATLELGGKDAAYVCHDADLDFTATQLCDGAFFNAGQSCCGIERIYVDNKIYAEFMDCLLTKTYDLVLGNPLEDGVSLGPMAKTQFAQAIREHVHLATAQGAKALVDESRFFQAREKTAYCAPQILIGVEQSSALMQQENFGPIVGVIAVNNEQQALEYINDSPYGLTASIWTRDKEKAVTLGNQAQVGTWFMNRCDYLHPALAWGGVKETGRGVSLSQFGFDAVTRLQSFNLQEV